MIFPISIKDELYRINIREEFSNIGINYIGPIEIGSFLRSGSAATKNAPPYAIIGGNPAKIIKYRFSEKTIDWIESNLW